MRQRNLLGLTLIATTTGAAIAACSDRETTAPRPPTASMAMNQNAQGGVTKGFTDGWFDGQTVQFFYVKNFFCAEPPESGATSNCEVGEDGTVDPRAGPFPGLYGSTPMGITVPQSTLHCPIAGSCINHPSTIDLSRLLGASAANVALLPH